MFEISSAFFDRLGLKSCGDLSEASASESRTYHVDDLRGRSAAPSLVLKIYEKDGRGSDGGGIWDTGRWSTRGADQWATGKHSPETRPFATPEIPNIRQLQLNWLIAEQGGHHFFPRITEVGELDGLSYLLREHHPQSLAGLARTRVVPNPAMLYQIVAGTWTALCFLHQPEVNVPHGNVKLSNILIGKGSAQDAEIYLCDAVETPETERKKRKNDDFRALGVMIYQMAAAAAAGMTPMDALGRAEGHDWAALGREGAAWKEIACRLLDEATYGGFNPAAERQAWLEPVRPKRARVLTVPLPVPAPPAGPVLGGDARARPPEQACSEIDELIRAGDFFKALAMGTKALGGKDSGNADILERIDYCAANLPAEAIAGSDALLLLEEAARLGSANAACRLGLALLKVDADEALGWLQAAVDHGVADALPSLALLLESGTPSHPADPVKALECMNRLRADHPSDDHDYLFAAMILRGNIQVAPAEAVALLTGCHQRGHFKSTDLLGQCHASGLGTEINEKRAYGLFVEAWNLSKASNRHYHTASNNLGVCFAAGFGVAKDFESAKHYFRQGALNKHRPSEQNLERLKDAAG